MVHRRVLRELGERLVQLLRPRVDRARVLLVELHRRVLVRLRVGRAFSLVLADERDELGRELCQERVHARRAECDRRWRVRDDEALEPRRRARRGVLGGEHT